MERTTSVIKADIRYCVGHPASHPAISDIVAGNQHNTLARILGRAASCLRGTHDGSVQLELRFRYEQHAEKE